MNTEDVTEIFNELVSLLELSGENPFKVRAYQKAIDELKAHSIPLETLIKKIEVGEITSFGPQITKDLRQLQEQNYLAIHQELLKSVPPGQLELLKLKGLGPKKVILLNESLGIDNITGLKDAIANDTLIKTKGFGAKTIQSLTESISFYEESKGYFLIDQHEKILSKVTALSPDFIPYGTSFSKDEIFKKIQIAYSEQNTETVLNLLNINKIDHSDTGIIQLSSLSEQQFQAEHARQNALLLNNKLKSNSLKGLIHVHSTYSDGLHSIEELAEQAKTLGYSYIGITDHSQSAAYAGGLKPNDIKAQHLEIDRLNKKLAPFRIFKGIESDILIDGSLDYPEQILRTFDFVIASVHSGFNLTKSEMTQRIIKALKNPFTRILGHPTGRLLLKRKGYELDIQEVLKVAKEEGKVVEINSNPRRLDISYQEIEIFGSEKNSWAITPDAHSKEQLDLVKYGLIMANKINLEEEHILNCLGLEEFTNWIKLKK